MKLKTPTDSRLYAVSAPSGSGKTSLIKKALTELKNLKLSVSHTTRDPRSNEIEGQDYFFIDENTFQEMIVRGDFLEYAKVFGEYYGTAKSFVEETLAQGHNIVMEIDWQGARQIRDYYPDTFSIFVLPPSLAVLQERLQSRAQDSKEVIASRMKQARSEAKHFNEYNHIIVNDDFDRASSELIGVLTKTISEIEIKESQQLFNQTIRALNLNNE